jgi:hypothetical protein
LRFVILLFQPPQEGKLEKRRGIFQAVGYVFF